LLDEDEDVPVRVFEPRGSRAPPMAKSPSMVMPGRFYRAKLTPRALTSAISFSTSSTDQNAQLAVELPAPTPRYTKKVE
jgi:hypothetical protein